MDHATVRMGAADGMLRASHAGLERGITAIHWQADCQWALSDCADFISMAKMHSIERDLITWREGARELEYGWPQKSAGN